MLAPLLIYFRDMNISGDPILITVKNCRSIWMQNLKFKSWMDSSLANASLPWSPSLSILIDNEHFWFEIWFNLEIRYYQSRYTPHSKKKEKKSTIDNPFWHCGNISLDYYFKYFLWLVCKNRCLRILKEFFIGKLPVFPLFCKSWELFKLSFSFLM